MVRSFLRNGRIDALQGGPGEDSLAGGSGDDLLIGDKDADELRGGRGGDSLICGEGNDLLAGFDQATATDARISDLNPDILNGGNGEDLIRALYDVGQTDGAITVTDFDPAEDTLVVVTGGQIIVDGDEDDGDALDPDEVITPAAANGQDTEVVVNGVLSAILQNTDVAALAADTGWLSNISQTDGSGGGLRVPVTPANVIPGSELPNDIAGTTDADVITALAGNDTIDGSGGTDTILAEAGENLAFGDAGDDLLVGNEEDDVLLDGDGADTLIGGEGDDRLFGAQRGGHSNGLLPDPDPDLLDGRPGDDLFAADDGDTVTGGDGQDTTEILVPDDRLVAPVIFTDFNGAEDSIIIFSSANDGGVQSGTILVRAAAPVTVSTAPPVAV